MTPKNVLMVAYHYPPCQTSSGIQRALKNSAYLGDFGWQPSVLSASPRAYARSGPEQLDEVPEHVDVRRAFALDSARHLAIRGRYPTFLALPDRWVSWSIAGILIGLRMIRKYRPAVIWSTYPIATAHLIALALRRLSGLPWVADCRDSMTEDAYPTNPQVRRVYLWIERKMMQHADRIVFTTESTRRMYIERYPNTNPERLVVIPNGYDEANFAAAERLRKPKPTDPSSIRLVHSGVLYPSERDPTAFFDAVATLRRRSHPLAARLQIELRATGHDELFARMIDERDIDDVVTLLPPIPYHAALADMLDADGLLIFQATNSNHQVPAKLFEYFRSGRPILGLTDPAGDTAATLTGAGIKAIARLDSAADIEARLIEFLEAIERGTASACPAEQMPSYSRRTGAEKLSAVLDAVVSAG